MSAISLEIIYMKSKRYEPFGPSVTLTAFARISTPLRILALPSFENLISLCAYLWATFPAGEQEDFAVTWRTALVDD